MIKLDKEKPNLLCQGITLIYWNQQPYTNYKNHLIMNHISISGEGTGEQCYRSNTVGIGHIEHLTIIINNSLFYELRHSALVVNNMITSKITIIMENCTFEGNSFVSQDDQITLRALLILHCHMLIKLFYLKIAILRGTILTNI